MISFTNPKTERMLRALKMHYKLVRELSEHFESDPNATTKRQINLLQEETAIIQSEAKRIRKSISEETLARPEKELQILEQAEITYSNLLEKAWKALEIGGVVRLFKYLDFNHVYPYMEAIPPLNVYIRKNEEFWKRRVLLEYPRYWDVYVSASTHQMHKHALDALLRETKPSSTRMTMGAPTASDGFYLLYQKARKLTRFLSRVSNVELRANLKPIFDYTIPVDSHAQANSRANRQYYVNFTQTTVLVVNILTQKITQVAYKGRFGIDDEDNKFYLGLHWLILINSQKYLGNGTAIHMLSLEDGEFITDEPRLLPPGVRFVDVNNNDVIGFEQRVLPAQPGQPAGRISNVFRVLARHVVTWALSADGTLESFKLGTTDDVVAPEIRIQYPPTKPGHCVVSHPSLERKLDFNVPEVVDMKEEGGLIRLDFSNNYSHPLLFVMPSGLISNGRKYVPDLPKKIDIAADYTLKPYGDVVWLMDQTDLMRYARHAIQISLKGPIDTGDLVRSIGHYVWTMDEFGQTRVYNLWSLYTRTLEPDESPLVSDFVK